MNFLQPATKKRKVVVMTQFRVIENIRPFAGDVELPSIGNRIAIPCDAKRGELKAGDLLTVYEVNRGVDATIEGEIVTCDVLWFGHFCYMVTPFHFEEVIEKPPEYRPPPRHPEWPILATICAVQA